MYFCLCLEVHLYALRLVNTAVDLLGVNEAVATADVGYFDGAVSVGGESG